MLVNNSNYTSNSYTLILSYVKLFVRTVFISVCIWKAWASQQNQEIRHRFIENDRLFTCFGKEIVVEKIVKSWVGMPSCSYITEWVIVRSAPGRAAAAPPISRCWSDAAPVAVPARLPANARPPLTGKHISNQLNPPAAALMRLSRAAVWDRSV